jgi:cell wall-associated NlpC family hydrolase
MIAGMRIILRTAMPAAALLAAGPACGQADSPTEAGNTVAGKSVKEAPPIRTVQLDEDVLDRIAKTGPGMGRLIRVARDLIGVPYKWGGSDLAKGIDCSNFTWLLYREIGAPYAKYHRTAVLARWKDGDGLAPVPFDEARIGDLLVYGHFRNPERRRRWHGHVVILIDKEGSLTGHRGLVLGAHGSEVGSVQFVTYRGFDEGYYKEPKMTLRNVLRPLGLEPLPAHEEPGGGDSRVAGPEPGREPAAPADDRAPALLDFERDAHSMADTE